MRNTAFHVCEQYYARKFRIQYFALKIFVTLDFNIVCVYKISIKKGCDRLFSIDPVIGIKPSKMQLGAANFFFYLLSTNKNANNHECRCEHRRREKSGCQPGCRRVGAIFNTIR